MVAALTISSTLDSEILVCWEIAARLWEEAGTPVVDMVWSTSLTFVSETPVCWEMVEMEDDEARVSCTIKEVTLDTTSCTLDSERLVFWEMVAIALEDVRSTADIVAMTSLTFVSEIPVFWETSVTLPADRTVWEGAWVVSMEEAAAFTISCTLDSEILACLEIEETAPCVSKPAAGMLFRTWLTLDSATPVFWAILAIIACWVIDELTEKEFGKTLGIDGAKTSCLLKAAVS